MNRSGPEEDGRRNAAITPTHLRMNTVLPTLTAKVDGTLIKIKF